MIGEVIYQCKTKATDREGEHIRHSINWVFARRGALCLTDRAITCGDWTIRYAEIDEAVLLAIPTNWGTAHTLRVKSAGKTYQFQLKSISPWRFVIDPFWLGEVPFPMKRAVAHIERGARRSLRQAIVLSMIVLWFVVLIVHALEGTHSWVGHDAEPWNVWSGEQDLQNPILSEKGER